MRSDCWRPVNGATYLEDVVSSRLEIPAGASPGLRSLAVTSDWRLRARSRILGRIRPRRAARSDAQIFHNEGYANYIYAIISDSYMVVDPPIRLQFIANDCRVTPHKIDALISHQIS